MGGGRRLQRGIQPNRGRREGENSKVRERRKKERGRDTHESRKVDEKLVGNRK